MQVVTMARPESTVPTKLSWRSVTEAMPTPKIKTNRENFIFWLQEHNMLSQKMARRKKETVFKQLDLRVCYLNCFLRKRVSRSTVNGIIASFVICQNKKLEVNQETI